MSQQDLILKTWGNPPLMDYKEIHDQESYGDHGPFGLRIFATVNRELSSDESIAIYKAHDLITKAIRTEDMRLDPEQQERKIKERAELLALFPVYFHAEELPNGYCSDWCCTQKPWYRVMTPTGWIKICWRKSVINIDWSETTNKKSGDEMFPGVSFTVGSGYSDKHYCHAWGYEAAKKQLAVVLGLEAWTVPEKVA